MLCSNPIVLIFGVYITTLLILFPRFFFNRLKIPNIIEEPRCLELSVVWRTILLRNQFKKGKNIFNVAVKQRSQIEHHGLLKESYVRILNRQRLEKFVLLHYEVNC